MYLLQSTADQDFLIALLALFVGLLITYYIIRGAVKSANKELNKHLKLQNTLKMKEMERMGYSGEELREISGKIFNR